MEQDCPDVPDNTWLSFDLTMLAYCDAVLAIEGWDDSEGATNEIQYAIDYKIPVYFNIKELHAGFINRPAEQNTIMHKMSAVEQSYLRSTGYGK